MARIRGSSLRSFLALVILFGLATVQANYYKKTRFDRSIDGQNTTVEHGPPRVKKQRTFNDHETRYIAYKDPQLNMCYLEPMRDSPNGRTLWEKMVHAPQPERTLYVSDQFLTKIEAWRLAGGRIVEFCRGRSMALLHEARPDPRLASDPFLNEIAEDENDIIQRRVSDVVLTPLRARAKREIQLEKRKMMDSGLHVRNRRQTPIRGRFRGQTQSQYLNFGNGQSKEGKAEAKVTHDSSHAVVSGTNGMGQAQGMSSGGSDCDECLGYGTNQQRGGYLVDPGTVGSRPGEPNLGQPSWRHPGGTQQGGSTPDAYYPSGGPSGGRAPGGRYKTGGESWGPGGRYQMGGQPGGSGPGQYPPGGAGRPIVPGQYPSGGGGSTVTGQYPLGGGGQGGPNIPGQYPSGGGGSNIPGQYPPGGGGSAVTGQYPPGGGGQGGPIVPGQYPSGGGTTIPGQHPSGGGQAGPNIPGQYPSGGGGSNIPGQYPPGGGGSAVTGQYPPRGGGQGGPTIPGQYPPSGGGTTIPGQHPSGGGQVGPNIPGQYPSGAGRGPNIPGQYPSGGGGSTVTGQYPSGGGGQGGHTIPGQYPSGGGGQVGPNIPGHYPSGGGGSNIPGQYPSGGGESTVTGQYPLGDGGQGGHTIPGQYPSGGGQVGPNIPGQYPSGGGGQAGQNIPGQYPSGGGPIIPGQYPSGGGTSISGQHAFGGGQVGQNIPGQYPSGGSGQAGQNIPGQYPSGGGGQGGHTIPGQYPSGGGTTIPGQHSLEGGQVGPNIPGQYPSGAGGGPNIPGQYPSGGGGSSVTGQYPSGGGGQGGHTIPGQYPSGGGQVGTNIPGQYPSGGGTSIPGQYPSGGGGQVGPNIPGQYPSGGGPTIPGQYPSGGVSTIPGQYPPGGGGQVGQTNSGQYPPGGGATVPGQYPPGGPTIPGQYPPGGGGPVVPGQFPLGGGGQGERAVPGQYPPTVGANVPGQYPPGGGQISGEYPSGGGGWTVPGQYPLGGEQGRPIVPGQGFGGTGGGAANWQYPNGGSGYPVQLNQYPGQQGQDISGGLGQFGGQNVGQQGGRLNAGGYDQNGSVVPGGTSTGRFGNIRENGGGFGDSLAPGADDDGESQASSSVQKIKSGTTASATSQGKFGQGTAQSQVQGTYTGTGSFSAQAGTNDGFRGAQTQVSGGKKGATSSASGSGGHGKSQAQVQLHSNTGATSSGAQSSGWNHGTNTQVQTGEKGGMADAQANGEGSTSSQAQIGFQPYQPENDQHKNDSSVFLGGGTASAQSGTFRGQSQAQLHGSFKYGISYNGAAQAGSGSGAQASRKAFNFSSSNTELFKPFSPFEPVVISPDETPDEENDQLEPALVPERESGPESNPEIQPQGTGQGGAPLYEPETDVESETRSPAEEPEVGQNVGELYGVHSARSAQSDLTTNPTNLYPQGFKSGGNFEATDRSPLHTTPDETYTDAANEDEYIYDDDEETYDTTPSPHLQSSQLGGGSYEDDGYSVTGRQPTQYQQTIIPQENYGAHVIQDSTSGLREGDILQPGQSLPGYTIPPGFRGKVTSVSGSETLAEGDGNSQSQTVNLIPGGKNVTYENRGKESAAPHARSLETPRSRGLARYGSSSSRYARPVASQHLRNYGSPTVKPNYYTITNSVAGRINGNNNSARKYEHRYYTKSSTCGYFTFSCNIVYGSNGRTKICKPKVPTNPDGTPIRC